MVLLVILDLILGKDILLLFRLLRFFRYFRVVMEDNMSKTSGEARNDLLGGAFEAIDYGGMFDDAIEVPSRRIPTTCQ